MQSNDHECCPSFSVFHTVEEYRQGKVHIYLDVWKKFCFYCWDIIIISEWQARRGHANNQSVKQNKKSIKPQPKTNQRHIPNESNEQCLFFFSKFLPYCSGVNKLLYCKTVYFYISSVIALYLQVFVPVKDYKPINPFTKYISRYIIINLKLKKMHYRDKIKFLCVSRDKGSFSTRGSALDLWGFFLRGIWTRAMQLHAIHAVPKNNIWISTWKLCRHGCNGTW